MTRPRAGGRKFFRVVRPSLARQAASLFRAGIAMIVEATRISGLADEVVCRLVSPARHDAAADRGDPLAQRRLIVETTKLIGDCEAHGGLRGSDGPALGDFLAHRRLDLGRRLPDIGEGARELGPVPTFQRSKIPDRRGDRERLAALAGLIEVARKRGPYCEIG